MLNIYDGNRPLTRRKLLTIGGLGLGGLSLPTLLASKAAAADSQKHISGKSVIFLFQQGGPSQFETFDPKPDAPDGVRTVTGVTSTNVSGTIFGDTMQQTAKVANKLNIVRGFQTGNGGHNIQPIVGPDSLEANIGVHYSRVAGATRPSTGVPTSAVIYPASVREDVPGPSARGDMLATGPHGKAYKPFMPGKGGQLQADMSLHLPRERFFDDRQKVLSELDRLNRQMDASGQLNALDDMQRQSYEILLGGGVAEALDVTKEDARTLARYDTSPYVGGKQWNHVSRGRSGYYNAQASSIGHLLLLARRLCEAGCGFVAIHAGYAGVWDMHADGNNLNMLDGMNAVGRSFDHAIAAFVNDVEERGLSDDIMLVCSGEMGRTPKINSRGGRDHWSKLAPLLVYGGGTRGGQIIGQSTRDGGEPVDDPITPKHLISTIMHTLFDVGQLRLVSGIPEEVTRLTAADPIPGLA